MTTHASIGALNFVLARKTTRRIGALNAEPLLDLDGMLVQRMEHRGRVFLVVDHRGELSGGCPSRVEVWKPERSREGPVRALIVLADARI